MKDFLDFEGKSVEQAVERACQELNVPKDQLAYDIISYGSTGIFGLVRTKKALIRVSAPTAKTDALKEGAEETSSDAVAGNDHNEHELLETDNRTAINALLDEAFGEAEASEAAPASDVLPEDEPVSQATDEAISVARALLTQIISLLSPDAGISVQREHDYCHIHISGGETAVLIGRKGQTLEAMQYLVDKAINKQCGKGYRIVVDVEGYLETRKNELTDAALRLAEKASRTGKPTTMNRMNAHDRRIVHLALKSNKAVRTQSVGDGYYRKLMILPKRRKRAPKPGSRSRQSP